MKKLILTLCFLMGTTALADAQHVCMAHRSDLDEQILLKAQARLHAAAVGVIVKAAQDAGITVDPSAVTMTNAGFSLMGLAVAESVMISGNVMNFYAQILSADANVLQDFVASDDAVYDTLGNLVTPATTTTCSAKLTYMDTFGVYNSMTNGQIGGGTFGSDETDSVGIASVSGSLEIPVTPPSK